MYGILQTQLLLRLSLSFSGIHLLAALLKSLIYFLDNYPSVETCPADNVTPESKTKRDQNRFSSRCIIVLII